jgi:hypothetical protein
VLKGLSIESAEFDAKEKRIKLSSKLSSGLPTILLQWIHKSETKGSESIEKVALPLYLTRSRKNLVTSVQMPTYGVPAHVWYQRGVALFA